VLVTRLNREDQPSKVSALVSNPKDRPAVVVADGLSALVAFHQQPAQGIGGRRSSSATGTGRLGRTGWHAVILPRNSGRLQSDALVSRHFQIKCRRHEGRRANSGPFKPIAADRYRLA
jgi:hypothetical protein